MDKPTPSAAPANVRRRRIIWLSLGAVVIIGGLLAVRFWYAPLGPALQAPAPSQGTQPAAVNSTAQPGATPAATLDPSDPNPPTAEVLPLASDAPAPAASPSCGERGVMRLLVLGSDSRTNDYTTGRADFIRAVRADFGDNTVRMLSVPRDLWLPIPNLKDHGILENRVNTAYSYGNYYELPGGGASLLADTLDQAFGLQFDHYLVVNFAAVEAGIDAIGGLDIDLPKDVDGTLQGMPYFKAGLNHMDGPTLLQYVRIRYIDSDLYRIDRQNQVLLALRAKLLSPQVLPAVPGLLDAMRTLINTDLSPAQLSNLACLGQNVGLENFTSLKIGAEQVTPWTTDEGANVLLPQYDLIAFLITAFTADVE